MSMFTETPVDIVGRALIEAWWSLQTEAIFAGFIDPNGSCAGERFTWEEQTGQCSMRLVKADFAVWLATEESRKRKSCSPW